MVLFIINKPGRETHTQREIQRVKKGWDRNEKKAFQIRGREREGEREREREKRERQI